MGNEMRLELQIKTILKIRVNKIKQIRNTIIILLNV